MEANLEIDISVEDLASVACLSQFHFSRAFRRATEKTPRRFVSDRRLEKAKEMLVRGEPPVAEVALICNFSSQASFTRAFTRATGLPPGEYRRRSSPGNSQHRALKVNADLVGAFVPPKPTSEHFALFRAYLDARHPEGGHVLARLLDDGRTPGQRDKPDALISPRSRVRTRHFSRALRQAPGVTPTTRENTRVK